jgi:chromosome segregation ATPase
MDEEIVSLADKIISILRQRKIIELSELAKQVGADEQEVQNIIEILEKEEMVDVGYSLTKVLISWNDEADRILMKIKKGQKITALSSSKEIADLKKNGKNHSIGKPSISHEKYEDKTSKTNADDSISIKDKFKTLLEKEPEEIKKELAVIQYQLESANKKRSISSEDKLAKKDNRESTHRVGAFAVKEQETSEDDKKKTEKEEETESLIFSSKAEGILKKSKQKSSIKKGNAEDKELDKEIKQIEKVLLLRLEGNSTNGEESHIIDLDESDIVKKIKQENVNKAKDNRKQNILREYRTEDKLKLDRTELDSDNQDLIRLENLLNQIVNKKAELIELNKERAVLFEKKHPELKSKITAELKAINELASDRENKIVELQKRLSNLPDVVEKIEKEVEGIKQARDRIERDYNAAIEEINNLKLQIADSKKETTKELAEIKSQIIDHEKEIVKVSNIYSSLKSNEEQLLNSLKYFKQRIAESQSHLINLENSLDEIKSKSRSIELRIEELEKGIKTLNHDFERSLAKLNQLQFLESKISELEKEYSSIKRSLDSKIEDYEKEIIGLKESINLDITNKYLQELQRITENSEEEYYSLIKSDELLNKQIELKKKELGDLISEVKELQSRINQKQARSNEILSPVGKVQDNDLSHQLSSHYSDDSQDGSDESFGVKQDRQIREQVWNKEPSQDYFVLNSDSLNEDSDSSKSKLGSIKSRLHSILERSSKIKDSVSSNASRFADAVSNKISDLSRLIKKK